VDALIGHSYHRRRVSAGQANDLRESLWHRQAIARASLGNRKASLELLSELIALYRSDSSPATIGAKMSVDPGDGGFGSTKSASETGAPSWLGRQSEMSLLCHDG
jgi:hypothetical protein